MKDFHLSIDGCEAFLAVGGREGIGQTLGQDGDRVDGIEGGGGCAEVVRADDAVARLVRNPVVEDVLDPLVAVVGNCTRVQQHLLSLVCFFHFYKKKN